MSEDVFYTQFYVGERVCIKTPEDHSISRIMLDNNMPTCGYVCDVEPEEKGLQGYNYTYYIRFDGQKAFSSYENTSWLYFDLVHEN